MRRKSRLNNRLFSSPNKSWDMTAKDAFDICFQALLVSPPIRKDRAMPAVQMEHYLRKWCCQRCD